MVKIHLSMNKANLCDCALLKALYTIQNNSCTLLLFSSECLSQFLEMLIMRIDLIVPLGAFQILTADFWFLT